MNNYELALLEIPEESQVSIKKFVDEFLAEANEFKSKIENLEIQGVDDSEGLKAARDARMFLKRRRGEAKDFVTEKRSEVKAAKLKYDQLDTAYLRSFQLIEATYKPIEEIAQEKEDYVKRLEEELKEQKRISRWEQLSKYTEEYPVALAEMTDNVFELVLKGAKSEHDQKVAEEKAREEARLEAERIEREEMELSQKRQAELRPYFAFIEKDYNLRKISEDEYQSILTELKQKRAEHEAEQEKVKLENERLKKEADELAEKARKEQLRLAKEQEEREEKLRQEAKQRAVEEAKKQAEFYKVKAELEAEKKRKAEQETKEEQERQDKLKAEQEATKAPEKDKIMNAINDLQMPNLELKELSEVYSEIVSKFESFKNWAKKQV